MWRDHLEYALSDDLVDLENLMFDQEAFTRLARKMISDLGLSDEYGEDNSDGESDEQDNEAEDAQPESGDEAAEQDMSGDSDLADAIEEGSCRHGRHGNGGNGKR
ncbi:MAG: hypothetical protein ACNYPE_14760 [Candidatus Azotimanducaceae bacterium WSBS_2022_MAG_OTU7]